MPVHSILFDKKKYTLRQSINWLSEHDFIFPKVHESEKYYRFQQFPPKPNDKYFTKTLSNGIKLVITL